MTIKDVTVLEDLPLIDTTGDTSRKAVNTLPNTGQFIPSQLWQRISLGVVVALAAFLNFFMLQENGYGNTYYASAVRSMLQSWHNFFFVSFDPGGFVTVDKPPLGLWIQTGSAALFGFSGFSLILPQALAGIAAVVILYHLVNRRFGTTAGLLAALFLALTPIVVVMNRDNNLDMLLVVTMLLAAWFVTLAAETGRLRWLMLGMVMVGLGFNIKTLEAYLVLPALVVLYIVCAPLKWWKRLLHLGLALLVMLTISFAWITIVDMVPANERPYVGSSQTDSELELTLGYNGLERLLGQAFGRSTSTTSSTTSGTGATNQPAFGGGAGGAGIGGNSFNGGESASITRMFDVTLGGQVSWLLPLALVSLLALFWQSRWRWPLDYRWQAAILWGIWLLTMGGFFSVANFFHQYYLVVIAPAICVLAAIGLVMLWENYQQLRDWRSWILPLALLLTAAEQAYLLTAYGDYTSLLLTIAIVCGVAAALLVLARLVPAFKISAPFWSRSAIAIAVVALLLTPTLWSVISISQAVNATIPTGGPAVASTGFSGGQGGFPIGNAGSGGQPGGFPSGNAGAGGQPGGFPSGNAGVGGQPGGFPSGNGDAGGRSGGFGGGAFGTNSNQVDQALISYLEAHQGSARFLVATTNSMTAAPIIIQTGKAVMALGGFSGSDPILTQAELATLVKNGTVRFFLLDGTGGAGGQGQGSLTSWVTTNCSTVSSQLTGSTTTLYDCSTAS